MYFCIHSFMYVVYKSVVHHKLTLAPYNQHPNRADVTFIYSICYSACIHSLVSRQCKLRFPPFITWLGKKLKSFYNCEFKEENWIKKNILYKNILKIRQNYSVKSPQIYRQTKKHHKRFVRTSGLFSCVLK